MPMVDWDAIPSIPVKARPRIIDHEAMESLSIGNLRNYVINERLNKNKDAVIAVCGPEGEGKSTLGYKLSKRMDPYFRLATNVIPFPTFDRMKTAIHELPHKSVIMADEAMLTMYKRQSMTSDVIQMNQLLALCRKYFKIMFYIMPRFEDFDERMREHRIALWIEIIVRGTAVVMYPNQVRTKGGRWELDRLYEYLESVRKGKRNINLNPKLILRAYKKHPAYLGTLHWTALPPEEEEAYLAHVKKHEADIEAAPEEKRDLWKEKAENYRDALAKVLVMLRDDLDMSWPEIHRKLGIPPSTARYILSEKGYKPRKVDQEVVEEIEEEVTE
jgi:hypothetical protein